MKRLLFFSLLGATWAAQAQPDPEFGKGLSLQAHWTSGLSTAFRLGTENYSGTLVISPQLTVVKGILRAGGVTGLSYADQKICWLAGPLIAVRLHTLRAGPMGTAGNLQLILNYLWQAGRPVRAGGSLQLETGKRFFTGPWVNAEPYSNTWWLHWGLGWRLGRNKPQPEPFNQ